MPANILIQLDPDPQPSVFDSVVAVDSGAEHLFRHGGVEPEEVSGLVHGAMFTRAPQDLKHTAIFVGGSDVEAGETLLKKVKSTFFGPFSVSVMFDANGANTTAAAAVLAAAQEIDLAGATAVVLGGTGPVGQRVARLLARAEATVRLGSRSQERADEAAARIAEAVEGARISGHSTGTPEERQSVLDGASVVIAAGAAGVELLNEPEWKGSALQLLIDLNAVPPAGIGGLEITDKGTDRDGSRCYGAIGIGGTKMKIHKAAVASLFESNDQVLDAEEIYAIGQRLS